MPAPQLPNALPIHHARAQQVAPILDRGILRGEIDRLQGIVIRIPDQAGRLAMMADLQRIRRVVNGDMPPNAAAVGDIGVGDIVGSQARMAVLLRLIPGHPGNGGIEIVPADDNQVAGYVARALTRVNGVLWCDHVTRGGGGRPPVPGIMHQYIAQVQQGVPAIGQIRPVRQRLVSGAGDNL